MTINETTTSTNEPEAHLLTTLAQREKLTDFIFDVVVNGDSAFETRLWQVCTAYQREIDRKVLGDDGSPELFQRVAVYNIMSLLLVGQLIDRLRRKKIKGSPRSSKDRHTMTMLKSALDEFDSSLTEFEARFPEPDLTDLGKLFWLNFVDISQEEAERDAGEIQARIAFTSANYTTEQIEAEMNVLKARKAARDAKAIKQV